MSTLFNKKEADEAIIKNLIRELRRSKAMSKVIKDASGKLWLVHNWEELTESDASALLQELQDDVNVLTSAITPEQPATTDAQPQDSTVATDAQPATDVPTPEQPAAPAPDVQPGPAPDTTPAPATDQQPVDNTLPAPTATETPTTPLQ